MEQSNIPEVRETVEVSKLHFLIHPGFLADSAQYDPGEVGWKEKGLPLLDIYIDHAQKIPDNELVLVFLHPSLSELRRDFKAHKPYTERVRQLKKILGKRMLAFSGGFDVFGELGDNPDDQVEEIRQLAEKRGFVFNQNVSSEAYGETLGVCVEDGANNLNKILKLMKKTIIKPELTDAAASLSEEDLLKHKQKIVDVFDYIDFE